MAKVVGYVALHYGREFLGYSIKSIIDYIDKLYVLYTPVGSHGARTPIPCPESREELYAIASAAAGNKLVWHEAEYTYEGQHREKIHELAPDADVILVLDADEIWGEGLAEEVIDATTSGNFKHWRVPIRHYWRSFNKCILHDPAFPVRVLCPNKPNSPSNRIDSQEVTYDGGLDRLAINHMGYAQTPSIVQYKWLVHGHIGEYRKDCDWFKDVYLNKERSTDLHPVGSDYWNYEHVDYRDYMPAFMAQHPFANLDWIE